LYAGTETGLFVSFDAGGQWVGFDLQNLPHVAVRDIFLQPEANDILLATHGRGLWILDDATPVQQLGAAAGKAAWLFPVRFALRYTVRATRAGGGDTEFAGANPPYGAILSYALGRDAGEVRFEVLDGAGNRVRFVNGDAVPHGPGVHRIAWDLRAAGAGARGPQVLPGVYTVRMTAGDVVQEQKVEVRMDPSVHVSIRDLQAQWDAEARVSAMMQGVRNRPELARPKGLGNAETGPRLAEQLASLFNLMDGANAAPTAAMMSLLAELELEYKAHQ
jgi:hypothetical protein